MMKKRLPAGKSIYEKVVDDNCYYVDKTLLVKDVLEGAEVIVYTRPRRFGKTLNLTMLRSFFEISDQNKTHLFQNTRIWQVVEYRFHHGRYPVIYLTFKDLKRITFADTYKAVQRVLSDEFQRHSHVRNSLNDVERAYFDAIVTHTASNEDYRFALKKLSQFLFRHHAVKPMVLIDEYDTPILAAYSHGFYTHLMDFFKTLLGSLLKDNEFLEKAVLTGITRVARESIFSDLNNINLETVLSTKSRDRFGLLRDEVETILRYYHLTDKEAEIIDWYNGYNFGGVDIYNPFSIISLVYHEGQLREYWVNTGENTLIKNLIRTSSADFKVKVQALLDGESIEADIIENLVFEDLERNEKHIWTMLLFSGYLKWVTLIADNRYLLTIPNREVQRFYHQIVADLLEDHGIQLDTILEFLLRGEILEFKSRFQEMVLNTISYFDTGGREPERFYHGLLLGMLVHYSQQYYIESNRESGFGRADLMLIPKSPEAGRNRALVFEFKRFSKDTDRTLHNSAVKGLAQIAEKNYIAEAQRHGIQDVIAVSMAFDGKQVDIASSLDEQPPLTEKQQIALRLLDVLDVATIAKKTGLTVAEVQALANADRKEQQ